MRGEITEETKKEETKKEEIEIIGEIVKNAKEYPQDGKDIRPWGGFITLWKDNNFRVKILFILPKKRLSLQKHEKRSEKLIVAEGQAIIIKNKKKFLIGEGDSVIIEKGEIHRIENPDEKKVLKIVEVWMGDTLDENDIIRLEDDFGRT